MTIREWCQVVYANTVAHGFTETDVPAKLMLIVTECSEAMEAWRKEKPKEEFAAELADIMIRTMSFAEGQGIDLEAAVVAKHNFNLTRPFRHGKNRV